jgi:hypothetical protein
MNRARIAEKGRSSAVIPTLNSVWALAIWRGRSSEVISTKRIKGVMKGRNTSTPTTLKQMWAMATRFASAFVPMELARAVAQVPMLAPKMTGMAADRGSSPCRDRVMARPMVAAELCTRAEKTAATVIPRRG